MPSRRIAGQRRTYDPPGWYTDESNPAVERYFNGGSWTSQTRPARPETPQRSEVDEPAESSAELVDLSIATTDRAKSLYRLADVLAVMMTVISVLAYLGCIAIAVQGRSVAGIGLALGVAAGVTIQLVAVLFLVAWGKTYALEIQRKVWRSAT